MGAPRPLCRRLALLSLLLGVGVASGDDAAAAAPEGGPLPEGPPTPQLNLMCCPTHWKPEFGLGPVCRSCTDEERNGQEQEPSNGHAQATATGIVMDPGAARAP